MRCRLAAAILLALAVPAAAQPKKAETKPDFLYGHDLKVRNVGEANFTPMTPKVGVEFFRDSTGGALVAITEAGHLAVVPFHKASDDKKADWLAAFELRVRDANVVDWKESKKVAMETFKDLASGKLLTISAQKTLALSDAPGTPPSEKEPAWHHGLVLAVRPAGDDAKESKKFGVEVFKDGTTGGLVYLTDQGFIATGPAPTKAPEPDAVKKPNALHAWTLQARKADEGDFTKSTKTYNLEVFADPNSGATLFMTDTGSLAAATLGEIKKGQGLRWSHSFALKARKGGDKDFDKASKYGVEVFEDKNAGALIYICENGSIAVMKK